MAPTRDDSTDAAPAKYDVKRALKECYAPRNTADWALVEVPPQRFLAVDGRGNPNTSADYARAVEALYATAYTIKFASKRALGRDFVVGPLEGLWWSQRPEVFVTRDKDAWQWRMLISLPDWITDEQVAQAKEAALAKKGLPAIEAVRPETLREGTSAQLLHLGSYDDEGPALARLHHAYLAANGLRPSGHHHEVYLSDPRRTAPARLRTVLRQPVRAADAPETHREPVV
ncbi:GyrI-like domain-containing protein [Streptomyces sp. DSM 44917]|uniref:GyrI-like domain-containing protein n=1 Tax=Streptomyces boetiae TaxID=3075541 RepID=A0ABU2LB18_9ACTN|nr:GyrI-like domain-containing protein [Streptomyces sp. DSM 44917]MDT0308666.1 GyrI-like domain-containing protein [Streptomyces sp. DSM 44917]